MRVVCVNTYAGSLLLGSRLTGIEPSLSLEDAGYGCNIQRANFPGLDVRTKTEDWPDQSLEDALVIAHPPCSWVSAQRGSASTGYSAFACTERVMDYAMGRKAIGVAIESVVQAHDAGWQVHAEAAKRHGYKLFRVLQNARDFGVPQNRPRFWAVFMRDVDVLNVAFLPNRTTLRSIMDGGVAALPRMGEDMMKQRVKLREAGIDWSELFSGRRGYGRIDNALGDKRKELYLYSYFGSKICRLLDPDGVSTVLLGDSWWAFPTDDGMGCVPSGVEWRRIMGFPDDYKINPPSRLREFLSKGVCPPVAAWILKQMMGVDSPTHQVSSGRTLDLR